MEGEGLGETERGAEGPRSLSTGLNDLNECYKCHDCLGTYIDPWGCLYCVMPL